MATSLSCSAGFALGMDLGTTSVKVVLLDEHKTVTDCTSFPTNSDISRTPDKHAKEQDPALITTALNRCMDALPKDKLQKVKSIGICGQMHGILLWKSKTGCLWLKEDAVTRYIPKDVSQLITWQDGRCSTTFLSSLPKPDSHLSVATGFGCATIFWYMRHRPEFLSDFTVAGTIQDYVVSMLCSLDNCVMTGQNAASWGYFNTTTNQWNKQILKEAGFPVHLLPVVVESGAVAGHTSFEWYGIPAHTPVSAALGDFQCSVYSCMADTGDAVNQCVVIGRILQACDGNVTPLTIFGTSGSKAIFLTVLNMSTSAQLTFAMPAEFCPPSSPDPLSPTAYFPYFRGSYLAVAASLNGGNVMATFVRMLGSWMKEFGLEVSESGIYSQLIQSGLTHPNTDLTVTPTLLGERHDPSALASIWQISPTNLSLGYVTRAVCRGIIQNMATMMPPENLQAAGVKRIIGSGSALSCNAVLKQEVEAVFPFPVAYGKDVDSAFGVAMVFSDQMNEDTK